MREKLSMKMRSYQLLTEVRKKLTGDGEKEILNFSRIERKKRMQNMHYEVY